MVRLLSMGTSRTREAFAHATRGKVFLKTNLELNILELCYTNL